jgi:hypothetical protein
MVWQDSISVIPAICHGRACVKGTRVMVSVMQLWGNASVTYVCITEKTSLQDIPTCRDSFRERPVRRKNSQHQFHS